MWDIIGQWEAKYVLALSAIVCASVVAIAIAGFEALKRIKLAGLEADLKRDALNRGLPIDQVERLIRAAETSDAEPTDAKALDADMASLLVQYEVSPAVLKQVLSLFQSAEPQVKPKLYDAITEMLDAEADEDALVVAVRTLCQPGRPANPVNYEAAHVEL